MKKLLIGILLIGIVLGCASIRPDKNKEHDELIKAWTPQVRDTFIEMGKESGCFKLKEVKSKNGGMMGCYSASMTFDKSKDRWVTECEPLCKSEAPECYADGWNPPRPDRCQTDRERDKRNE